MHRPSYCVPAKAYEELMDLVEDLELRRIDEEDRLICRLEGSTRVILACRYH